MPFYFSMSRKTSSNSENVMCDRCEIVRKRARVSSPTMWDEEDVVMAETKLHTIRFREYDVWAKAREGETERVTYCYTAIEVRNLWLSEVYRYAAIKLHFTHFNTHWTLNMCIVKTAFSFPCSIQLILTVCPSSSRFPLILTPFSSCYLFFVAYIWYDKTPMLYDVRSTLVKRRSFERPVKRIHKEFSNCVVIVIRTQRALGKCEQRP